MCVCACVEGRGEGRGEGIILITDYRPADLVLDVPVLCLVVVLPGPGIQTLVFSQ